MIRAEPIDKWVRGRLDGRVLVESREPLLVWQGLFPPVYAFRRDEVVDGVLVRTEGRAHDGFFFFGPQLPVAQWYDVVAGDRVLPCAAWSLDDDALRDRVVLTWEPGLLQWTEEDEAVTAHPRYYLPREDVRLDLLQATDNTSVCPYKGQADGYWTWPGPPSLANVAWSYSSPAPAVGAIADHVAFYNELVDLTVDGTLQVRPESPFSQDVQRPGADS